MLEEALATVDIEPLVKKFEEQLQDLKNKLDYLLKLHNICPSCGAKMKRSTVSMTEGFYNFWQCQCGNKYYLKKGFTFR